jgi:hypothetical protein
MDQVTLRRPASPEPVLPRLRLVPPAPEPPPVLVKKTKWLLVGISFALAAAVVWLTTGAARECQLKPIPVVFGQDTEVAVEAPSGTPCSVRALTGSTTVEDLRIESQPQFGAVVPRGRTGVVYRPDPKFKGEDSFTFALRGGASSLRATSVVRVHVTLK